MPALFLRRASGALGRIRFPSRPAPAAAAAPPWESASFDSSFHLPSTKRCFHQHKFNFSTSSKNYENVPGGFILFAQAAFVLGVSCGPVLAEDASTTKLVPEKDRGDAYITGLRRIEDGSVVSNSHTSKWRIFTDNGRDLFLKGKLDEAEKYFLLALQEAKKGFGERDPHVASSCNNLAELYRVQKTFQKAEPLYLEAIDILEEAFGPEDIRVGAALHNLGQFYLAQRKLKEARTCYERALKIKGRVLGYGHIDYANTMYHLGTVLYLQGNDEDSEALIKDFIRILEEGGLGDSMSCIRRMRYLSQILLKSNRLSEVETLQRKMLLVLEISKGWDSPDTVISAEQLALTLQSLGSLAEAQELMERCLNARKSILHEDHIQVAANLLHMARIAMLYSNHLRKISISEARAELDKAKLLLDNSVRIARVNLDHSKENQSNLQDNRVPGESRKDDHTALIILLQSLDAVGLLEVSKLGLQEPREAHTFPIESERALRECISIFKQPGIKRLLLNYPDAKGEYLSCLRHLVSIVSEYFAGNETHHSKVALQEMKDELRHIEEDLSVAKKK